MTFFFLQTKIDKYAMVVQTDYGRSVIRTSQQAVDKARQWANGMRARPAVVNGRKEKTHGGMTLASSNE